MLYTFVLEYGGGTFVSQLRASSWRQAPSEWAAAFSDLAETEVTLQSVVKQAFAGLVEPVKLDGLSGVYCATSEVDGELVLLNYVCTVSHEHAA